MLGGGAKSRMSPIVPELKKGTLTEGVSFPSTLEWNKVFSPFGPNRERKKERI